MLMIKCCCQQAIKEECRRIKAENETLKNLITSLMNYIPEHFEVYKKIQKVLKR